MTLEDPFFVVKDEVSKALNKTKGLYQRWLELQKDTSLNVTKDDLEWTTTELRNSLRSIEWDIDDLEDTKNILSLQCINPSKFKIDNKELTNRKLFIEQAREEVKIMRDKMNINKNRDRDRTARQPLLDTRDSSPVRVPSSHGSTKYSKLENDMDSPSRQFLDDTLAQQRALILGQDDTLDAISDSVGTLKTVSRQIGSELDEHAVMLEDFGNEMDSAESKMDATMKKVAKIMHMTNERRQWIAIGVLTCILLIIIMLFKFL
ncbi:hypothetical protein ONE63_001133 [Megalurothrips usitatus]|uniref:t-SNARE coiled-coil homology domain-containing protein n=1 Tax=Megalurothrips usitatus TaxID=439358 RepID=A0AAV7XEW4_9NEOP|nr:hypothetical protein ONE63_001133 [Megalurothrips usitatus]